MTEKTATLLAAEQDALIVFKKMLHAYLVSRDTDAALALTGARIHYIGTGGSETALNREELQRLFRREMALDPAPYSLRYDRVQCDAYSPEHVLIEAELSVFRVLDSPESMDMQVRVTSFLHREQGQFHVCGLHGSIASILQTETEYFPVRFGLTMLENIKHESGEVWLDSMKQLPSMVLGHYMAGELPLYFVSEPLLHALGYAQAELADQSLPSLLLSGERDETVLKLWKQLLENDSYELCCRLQCKDGTPLTVVLRGRVAVTEDGRLVAMSHVVNITSLLPQIKQFLP